MAMGAKLSVISSVGLELLDPLVIVTEVEYK